MRRVPFFWKVVVSSGIVLAGATLMAFLPEGRERGGYAVPLVGESETMITAWDIPMNPATDTLLGNNPLAEQIRNGFRIFTNTAREVPQISRNALSCNNCHLNAGQRDKALPLVGVATVFPEYNRRAGRLFSLEDRIVGCFLRSQNAVPPDGRVSSHENDTSETFPSTRSKEVLALSAYITWLSRDLAVGAKIPWRGHNVIAADRLIPVAQLDPTRGEALFKEHCTNCHGDDGQGVDIGDKKAGPLWGPASWNDGAGAARIYTLAGFIRYAMPYLSPGILTDEEAQHISAFINAHPRPTFTRKEKDYLTEPLPPDAVYYLSRTSHLSGK